MFLRDLSFRRMIQMSHAKWMWKTAFLLRKSLPQGHQYTVENCIFESLCDTNIIKHMLKIISSRQSVSECLMNFVRRFFRRAQDEIWIHTRRKWSALIQNSKRAPGACSCFQLTLGALIDECGISFRFHVAPNIQNMTISLVKRKQLEQTVVLSLSSGRKIIHIDKSQSALSCDVE